MNLERFELIDDIVTLDAKDGIVEARMVVPAESPVFEGHFPGFPLVPGVMLIEAMAQTCGLMVLMVFDFQRMAFLSGVTSAKFRGLVKPNDVLAVHGSLVQAGQGYAVAKGRVLLNDQKVAEAEIKYGLVKFPNPAIIAALHDRAARLGVPLPEAAALPETQ